jgi:hypothetical protein
MEFIAVIHHKSRISGNEHVMRKKAYEPTSSKINYVGNVLPTAKSVLLISLFPFLSGNNNFFPVLLK